MRDEGRGLTAETLGTLSLRRAASRGFSLSTPFPHPSSLFPVVMAPITHGPLAIEWVVSPKRRWA